jgi:hypothetical protein
MVSGLALPLSGFRMPSGQARTITESLLRETVVSSLLQSTGVHVANGNGKKGLTLKDAVTLVFTKVGQYLSERFSGKIVFVFHCRDGGIGRLSLTVDQDLTSDDLTQET